jgi:heme-degrading monooxygenase HmoA
MKEGTSMFVRVGEFDVKPGALVALRERYNAQAAPLVRSAPGSVDCFLLEPVDPDGPAAVCTMWETEADATAYEASGSANTVVDMVREFFAGPPALRSYRVTRG